MVCTSRLLGPKVYQSTKMEAYECGVPAVGKLVKAFLSNFIRLPFSFCCWM
ncbi:MAG: NADH-quinone oxidoreductase subunit A [Bdellovibrionota bacterium]